ncbi:MAG TPA: VWA domain-containing protein, partial [Blastocatellia bacterium]|nr:VWA domain-containing protein [Blastocatellia bacterium]
KRTRIPFLGLAGFIVKIVRPAGVKGFKLAVFEDQNFSGAADDKTFESVMNRALGDKWQPMIRSYSRRTGERTYIFSKPNGKDMELMIATLESNEAVVLQVKVNPDTLAKWLEKPGQMGGIFNARKHRDDVPPDDSIRAEILKSIGQDDSDDSPTLSGTEISADVANASSAPESENKRPELALPAGAQLPVEEVAKAEAPNTPEINADVRINTRLINLNTKVVDATGKTVLDLKPEDFEIYEDNIKQEISHFAPVTAPISLVLLLDLSGSMKSKEKEIKRAAKKFVQSLNPSDRVAVATFTRSFKIVSDFTSDRKLLEKRIDKIKNHEGGTAFYDSMWTALDFLNREQQSRKAIVVLTDGVDSSLESPKSYPPKHPFNELMFRMTEEDVTVYPMYMNTEYEMVVKKRREKASSHATAREQLNVVAEQTGGLMFRVDHEKDLEGVYQRVAAELRTLYSLAYSSNNEDSKKQWRKVRVKAKREGLSARTKQGYYAR